MKKCPMCGNENDDIAKTCTNCGAKLDVDPKLTLKPNAIYTKAEKRPRSQEELLEGLIQLTASIEKSIDAIRFWITFIGVIVLLSLLFNLLSSCSVL